MGKKLYVGNLRMTQATASYKKCLRSTEQSSRLRSLWTETRGSKGFGFVEMSSDQEAQAAITGLNGRGSWGAVTHRQRSQTTRRSGWRQVWRRWQRWLWRTVVGGGRGGRRWWPRPLLEALLSSHHALPIANPLGRAILSFVRRGADPISAPCQLGQARELSTAAEADAREHRRGLWADPNPVPPWEWRREKRRAATPR